MKASLTGAVALLARLAVPDRALARALPPGELSLYNTHSGERQEIAYRDAAGRYDPAALTALDHILRCPDGQVARMDIRVIEYLNLVDKTLGGEHEVQIVSGFRSPAYNAWLQGHGPGVAQHSLHLVGRAIDLRVTGIGLDVVRRTALGLELGGVGYYPRSEFVHIDSGRVRMW